MTNPTNAPVTHAAEPADSVAPAAPPPPPPPRPLTRRARLRSWNELPVRIWVILAVAVLLITVYFAIDKYFSGRYQRWLIREGLPVQAEVLRIHETTDPRQEFRRTDRLPVQLKYTVDGRVYDMEFERGWLAQLPDQRPVPTIRVGDTIEIRVDPNHPTVWTDRTEPLPWVAEFTIALFLLPLLVLLALIALLRRYQVLSVWRSGEAAAGVVVEHKQTAVAPFSRIIRFTLADGRDRRVWSTLHPARGAPEPGETMWLIFPSGNPGRAVVAGLYE